MPGPKKQRLKPTVSQIGGAKISAKLLRRIPALGRKPEGWDRLSRRFKQLHSSKPEETLPDPYEPSKYGDD